MPTKIEWVKNLDGTQGETWNPVTGCSKVSPGCDNCYGERLAMGRLKHQYPEGFGKVTLHPERLEQPLHWKKPRMLFVCSMSDLFHPRVPFEFIESVFCVVESSPQHTYQFLTKRPGRMAFFANHWLDEWPPNAWAGVSVENQKYAPRLDVLARVPAAVRFVSVEPMLGPVDLSWWLMPHDEHKRPGLKPAIETVCGGSYRMLDFVIVGGESGPHARPMHPAWVRSIRDQCVEAGIPYFFKGWGEWRALIGNCPPEYVATGPSHRFDDGMLMLKVGRKAVGAMLDGMEWRQMPEATRR